jgi:hypothetical protein
MGSSRPGLVTLFCAGLLVCALLMAWVGSMAAGYFVCVIALVLEAVLLWTGRWRRTFEIVLLVNQVSGLLLILDLWLGGGLGDLKLDISGVCLLINLAVGGPLLAVAAIPLILSMRFGARLPAWFAAQAA